MALQGLLGTIQHIFERPIQEGEERKGPWNPGPASASVESAAISPALKADPRFPITPSGNSTSLAVRLLSSVARLFAPSAPSPLSKPQEKLLKSILASESAGAETILLSEFPVEVLAGVTSGFGDYASHLLDRIEALESRFLDEVTELDEAIEDQTDLLSGNEAENEGLTDAELEIESLEKLRTDLEADLETLASLKEELSIGEDDPTAYWETVAGLAQDLLGVERDYLQKDWDRALEDLRGESEFAKLPHVQSQLESLGYPSLENFETLVLLQAQAELWAVTEARIGQFGEMMKVSGMTDGIVNMGGFKEIKLTYAQEYSERQADYTKVLRYLREGKAAEALELFQGLEGSRETEILFEAFEDVETINACTVNALTVVGAGAAARLAMPIVRGFALLGNVSSKTIPALQFGGQVGTFTLAHRQMNGWVMDQAFFDPNLSPIQNAEALSQEFLFNAGMFAFLGMSQKLFAAVEGKALQGLAKRKGSQASLKTYGPMTIEAEAASELFLKGLQKSQLTKLAHVGGSFGTELVGFGAWDYLAANLQSLANGDYDAKRIFTETLGSKDKWEHNLVFIAALKAGGALAAPVFRPMNRAAEGFAKAKYRDRLAELDQTARDCAQALEGHLEDPQGSLELLARYEASLESKLSFLRDIPSELSHPAGLGLLKAEIKNVRELKWAIEAGVFDTPANDAYYRSPIPRIGKVLEPSEPAANGGNYGLQEAGLMPLAVGAEVFEVGERVKLHPAPSPEVLETGLQVYNMAKGGEVLNEGVLRRLGNRVVGIFKRSSPSEPVPASLAPTLDPMEVKLEHAEVAVPPLFSLIPPTRLERPKTVSIPGGIRALGSPDFSSNPVQWREIGGFELATRPVTNREVETYAEEYRDYPQGLIWGDGNRYHLIGRGSAWDAGREEKAKAVLGALFESLAKNHLKETDPIWRLLLGEGSMLELIAKLHPRAPVFEWDPVQKRYSNWLEVKEEYSGYAVLVEFLQSMGIEPSFEGFSLFFEGLKERGYFAEGWTFERQRVVPELGGRKLGAGFNGSEQAATEINWYEAVGVANAMGGRLPTEWEWEVAARGPAERMATNSNLENFENFYVGEVNPETAPMHDLGMVRDLIARGTEVFGYRRYGTKSGGRNAEEAWYGHNTLPDRADWGLANGYGLHGMAGGVWEWAGNNYEKIPWRSYRGGSWSFIPDYSRAAYRSSHNPDDRGNNNINVGLRVQWSQDSRVE